MSRLYGPIFQAAYVVTDFDAAVAHWTKVIGVGPFFLFPTPLPFSHLAIREETVTDYDIISRCGLAYSGDTLIELIAPGTAPSPYLEFLAAGRSGLHHVGTIAEDYDAQMAVSRAAGVTVAMEGVLPISRFAYLDTDTVFPGAMVEIIDMSAEMRDMFGAIKAASVGWDGKDPLRSLE
jgi:catechol 2,3-dioxygenase-like lactoylglutathione lyase family enzyme